VVVSAQLKNILVKLDHFCRKGKHLKMKPPSRNKIRKTRIENGLGLSQNCQGAGFNPFEK